MKKLLLLATVLSGLAIYANASGTGRSTADGPLGNVTITPASISNGNTRRSISVPMSSITWTLISDAPENVRYVQDNTTTTLSEWRERTIINCSTVSALTLTSDNTSYAVASSSYGITLSTGFNGVGDSYTTHDQAQIWGRWLYCPNDNSVLAGAAGEEQFFKPRNK